jgi:hypothetical protein
MAIIGATPPREFLKKRTNMAVTGAMRKTLNGLRFLYAGAGLAKS